MSLEKLKGKMRPLCWGRGIVTWIGPCVGGVECVWLVACDEDRWAWRCGGPTQVVLRGGYPGRALGRIGTLVVRMMGSSLLVEDVVDGGGAATVGLVPAVVRCKEVVFEVAGDVVRVDRLR